MPEEQRAIIWIEGQLIESQGAEDLVIGSEMDAGLKGMVECREDAGEEAEEEQEESAAHFSNNKCTLSRLRL